MTSKSCSTLFVLCVCLLVLSACTDVSSAEITATVNAPATAANTEYEGQSANAAYPNDPEGSTELPASPPATPSPPAISLSASPYPGLPTPTRPSMATAYPPAPPAGDAVVYFPFTGGPDGGTEAEPIETPAPRPTIDVASLASQLSEQGRELSTIKIGFHVTLPEDRTLLDDWMKRLDEAGIPIFLKSVDNAEPLFKAQQLMAASGVPHTLVFRSTGSVPHYELPASQAAEIHWQEHKASFPAELDPAKVWIETLNEPDRMQAEWLGQFALRTAELAMADGFRWAAFGWASGEPELEHWRSPSMLAFLRLAAEQPDRLAVAVHEYSFLADELGHEYPHKVGRFLDLFRVADENNFARPTVLITEWGWEYADVPDPERAMDDIRWASALYAPFPQVKGAAIWNLGIGCCFDDISEQTQELIDPLTELALTEHYSAPRPPERQSLDPSQFRP